MANIRDRLAKGRTYPDQTLERAARAAGARIVVLWEMRGPEHTAVDWMVGYQIGKYCVIVQTYTDGNGWNAFLGQKTNDIAQSIADVLNHCEIPAPSAA